MYATVSYSLSIDLGNANIEVDQDRLKTDPQYRQDIQDKIVAEANSVIKEIAGDDRLDKDVKPSITDSDVEDLVE